MSPIAVITNDELGIFQRSVLAGIRSVAEEESIEIEVISLLHRSLPADYEGYDGLIVVANVLPDDMLQLFYEDHVPLTLISHHVSQVPIPTLMFNHAQGIQLLTQHLIENCGRCKLIFVRGIQEQLDAQQREAAFRRELMRHELDIDEGYFIQGGFSADMASQSIEAFISTGRPFDAVLASDFVMAAAMMQTLRRHGIRVPEDVSVVGFGDAPIAAKTGITTVAADVEELGQRAMRQLISQMSGLPIRGVTTLSVQLVIRSSCGYQPED